MDTETKELVADLTKQVEELKDQVSEKDVVIAVLTGELIKKRVDPDYLV